MNRLYFILRKEFIQIMRDKRLLGPILVAPVIQLILFGYVATLDIKHISTVVCDLDSTVQSRRFIESFKASGYFDLNYYTHNIKEIHRFIDSGASTLALNIPRGFAKKIKAGKTGEVQIIIDGTNSNTAIIVLGYVRELIGKYEAKIAPEIETHFMIDNAVRVWYNPELKSSNFMVPGVICLILTVMTMILGSVSLVKEKEQGTIEQLIVTPIKGWELILGKILPFVVIGYGDIILILLVGSFWFNVPIMGSIPLLLGLSGFFLLNTLGLGLFISTISRTQQQALMTAFFFMMPFVLLSGFIFPIDNMPKPIQYLTYLVPLRYFLVIIRGICLKGVGLSILWPQALSLALLGIGIFALSVARFHKRLE